MKSDLVLLVTRDPELQQQWTIAALASGARSAIAGSIAGRPDSLNLVVCDARLSKGRVGEQMGFILLDELTRFPTNVGSSGLKCSRSDHLITCVDV